MRPWAKRPNLSFRDRGRYLHARAPIGALDLHFVEAELVEQLGGHQAKQVGTGRLADARRLRERILRAARPADDVFRFEHPNLEPSTAQQRRGDQAVVPCTDSVGNRLAGTEHRRGELGAGAVDGL